jgi:hypothetical protein
MILPETFARDARAALHQYAHRCAFSADIDSQQCHPLRTAFAGLKSLR